MRYPLRLTKELGTEKGVLRVDISNPELDNVYDRATTIGGAAGGKLIGAGGGGFFLFWTEDKKKLKEALADYKEMPFVIDKYGSKSCY